MKQELVYKWKVKFSKNVFNVKVFSFYELKNPDFPVILSTLRVLHVG